ncbi:Chromo domain-containing protein, partial [Cephalotus follicularis]
SNVHDIFHISMLRRYIPDPSHVLDYDTVPVQDDLSCEELPVRILDRKTQTLRNRAISMVKVQWQFHKPDEATWEREEDIRNLHKKERRRQKRKYRNLESGREHECAC